MAAETNEPRALQAALAGPELVTRGAGLAMHVANRHVERWAPEAGANRVRPLRSLGFVDRLVSPWLETATRSAGLRMFTQYVRSEQPERAGNPVSWVFPRPWYQDELDWMAAARQSSTVEATQDMPAPSMFTTRGTYVAPTPAQQRTVQPQMPSALYEYIAPSLSLAQPQVGTVGWASVPASRRDAFMPLVPLAAVQATQLAARVASVQSMTNMRSMLASMVQRSAQEIVPTRASMSAPELETPPAPRRDVPAMAEMQHSEAQIESATRIAEQVSAQRAKIADLQRVSRQVAAREAASSSVQSSEAVTQRAAAVEAEIRARTTAAGAEARPTGPTTDERARVEAQIQQRIAERTRTRSIVQMHEQARAEATAHATNAPIATAATPQPIAQPTRSVPSEVLAAIAALPPELHRTLAAARPDRVMHAIGELGEQLRTAELIARNTASNRAPAEVTRGPRLVMPVGLGGLVSSIGASQAVGRASVPADFAGVRVPSFTPQASSSPQMIGAPMAQSALRMPTMAWLAPSQSTARATTPSSAAAPMNALAATTAHAPTSLQHVAWADRWLARFAGATSRSLDVIGASTATHGRGRSLAAMSPGEVFVGFDGANVEQAPQTSIDERGYVSTGSGDARMARLAGNAPMLTVVAPPSEPTGPRKLVAPERYDDNAETPDDVFASIAATASRKRVEAARPTTASSTAVAASAPSQPNLTAVPAERPMFVDALARAVPSAPDAGMASGLAASPYAAALHHILPITASRTFDVRALFGSELGSTFLAGLLAPSMHEMSLGESTMAPKFASAWLADPTANDPRVLAERIAPEWSAEYVAPMAPDDAEAGTEARPTESTATEQQPLTTLRTALLSWNLDTAASASMAQQAGMFAPTVESISSSSVQSTPASSQYRSMLEQMSMPMLGDALDETPANAAIGAPGMVGSRAHAFSVETERSAADLSFDFVTPELVLAARVYGFGPTEAIQAARLATVGPTQLSAMAGAVDRTFVQAMSIDAEGRRQLVTAYPAADAPSTGAPMGATSARAGFAGGVGALATSFAGTTGGAGLRARPSHARADVGADLVGGFPVVVGFTADAAAAAGAAAAAAVASGADSAAIVAAATAAAVAAGADPAIAASTVASITASLGTSWARESASERMPMVATGSAFGVQRRAPRGAFLWPAATVAALGLDAPSPDGNHAMSVAALELLAAQAVAEIGTYAAISRAEGFAPSAGTEARPTGTARATGGAAAPSETEVLETVATLVPSARRARFDALYVALGQSSAGREWSPAARAARALALASRGEDGVASSAHERAATVWDVLPVVYANNVDETGTRRSSTSTSTSTSTTKSGARSAALADGFSPDFIVDHRPGLAGLSARAGEALGSYVTPQAAPSSSSSSSSSDSSSSGAVLRAPTAQPEYVRTGSRPSARTGGGEAEIPAWFEAAARKMFEDRSGVSDGISLSELTLVTSTPSSQIAASERGVSHSTPAQASQGATGIHAAPEIDVEKLAYEVYRQILELMDTARSRNGEYL